MDRLGLSSWLIEWREESQESEKRRVFISSLVQLYPFYLVRRNIGSEQVINFHLIKSGKK